ncbi:MAG: hypothetical protein ABIK67_05600 [candidate division WOR-3 bacterium]
MLILFLWTIFEFYEPGGPGSSYFASTTNNSFYSATAINPAMLSRIDKSGIGLVICQPYGISNLTYSRLAGNLNRPSLGLSLATLGQTGYHEYTFTFALSFPIDKYFSYGLILKGYYLNIENYGDDLFFGLNLGLLYQQRTYRVGIVIEDLNKPRSYQGDLIITTLRIGATFLPTDNLTFSSDFLKNGDSEQLMGGVEFMLLPIFSLRIGLRTNPYQLALGFGIIAKHLNLDYTYRYHPSLKETHIISLAIKS